MKKLKYLFLPTILALAFGLMLSCAKKEDGSSSKDTSSSEETNTSSSSAITLSGKVQKGPYIQGTEITVRELDSSMIPTGNTFTGTIDDDTGNFRVKGTLTYKIVELSADGYYFNEVSGSLSSAKLTLSALSDLTDSSSVNVNLMTHLEKKRVEYLIDSGLTFAAAKTQAQTEIMKIFNIENVTLGNSESLDISKSGDGNAVLLAISAILQSDKTEAELTELLSAINTDIRYDGTIDVSATKQKLLDGVDYIKPRIATIRSNIETRYSNVGMVASIPAFESYVLKLDITAPTVASTSHADNSTKIAVNLPITATFSDYLDNSTVTSTNFFLNDNSSNLITSTITYSDKTATLTPSSNLSENGTHIATIKTGITDLAGHALESDYSWSFKTGDFTAPIVAEETAVTSLTNDSTPSYTFSSTETGTITYGGSCSSSTTAAASGNNTIEFNSLSDGTYSNDCTIKVTDSAGNAGNTITLTSFTIDTVAPTVSSTSPSNGSITSISNLSVTFSDVIDNSTLTTSTIKLVDNTSNSVSGTVSSSDNTTANNTTVTFTPTSITNGSYTATVSNAVKDLAGNSLAQNYSWSFEIKWLGTKQLGTSSDDIAYGIATDSSGNVYVAGFTSAGLDGNTSAGNADLFVVKYNSSGTKQWTKQLGTSSNDYAYGIATDSSGNVYVTGSTGGELDGTSAGGQDAFVVKYNSSGTKQWTKHLGTSLIDYARGVATDSSGNVYVTGSTTGGLDGTSAGGDDLFVVKYSSSGTKQWTKQLGTSSNDYARGVATDSSGNVYVTGYTTGGLDNNTNAGDEDPFVVKYDSSGTKQWTKQPGTSYRDWAYGVATDSSGNVYVTGSTAGGLDGTSAGGSDLFVVKYNSSGTKQWTKQLGTSSGEYATGVATDSSGNVYVTGEIRSAGLDGNTSAGVEDLFVVKYNSSGTKQWTKQLGTESGDVAYGVATDSSGNVYVTGSTGGGLDGNTNAGSNDSKDIFLVKYNSSGTKQ